MNHHLAVILCLGAFLFSTGLVVLITRSHLIMMLFGLELMLNGANLNLLAFNTLHPEKLDGQMFALFIILVAVCEAAVGIALVLRVYRFHQTAAPDQIRDLMERP